MNYLKLWKLLRVPYVLNFKTNKIPTPPTLLHIIISSQHWLHPPYSSHLGFGGAEGVGMQSTHPLARTLPWSLLFVPPCGESASLQRAHQHLVVDQQGLPLSPPHQTCLLPPETHLFWYLIYYHSEPLCKVDWVCMCVCVWGGGGGGTWP